MLFIHEMVRISSVSIGRNHCIRVDIVIWLCHEGGSLDEPAFHPRPLLCVQLPNFVPYLLREQSRPSLLSVPQNSRLSSLVRMSRRSSLP